MAMVEQLVGEVSLFLIMEKKCHQGRVKLQYLVHYRVHYLLNLIFLLQTLFCLASVEFDVIIEKPG